jgi:hypothetical protein
MCKEKARPGVGPRVKQRARPRDTWTPSRAGARPALIAAVVAIAVSVAHAPAPAMEPSPLDAKTGLLIARYVDNPVGNRRALQALERQGLERLPVGVVLVVADAYMRSGNNPAAIRAFLAVLDREAPRPLSTIAQLGIGWAVLAEGDLSTARAFLLDGLAAETTEGGQTGPSAVQRIVPGLPNLARLGVALLDAYDGSGIAAATVLDHLAVAPGTEAVLRPVARLGSAYARYWAGAYSGAAIAFDLAAFEYPQAPTADDARYAAAWSRWRGGERDRALEDLHAQARGERSSGGRASKDLVDLDPYDVLVGGLRADRHPLGTPAQRLAGALDLDGVRLARAALRRIERGDDEEGAEEEPVAVALRIAPESEQVGRPGRADRAGAPVPAAPFEMQTGVSTRDAAGSSAAGSVGAPRDGATHALSGAAPGAVHPSPDRAAGGGGLVWLAIGLVAIGVVGGALGRKRRPGGG